MSFLEIGLIAAAAALSWLGVRLIRPWLVRHANAVPNARSSHQRPTPQGVGIAVIAAALGAGAVALVTLGPLPANLAINAWAVVAGAVLLALVGLADDIKNLSIGARLGAQAAAIFIFLVALPAEVRIFPNLLPLIFERVVLFVAGIWFINLYNFMDGIDLITATETISIGVGIILLSAMGYAPEWTSWAAAAIVGATIGFAFWNVPPAKVFLGDAGSLSLGFAIGVLLVHVAASIGPAAAAILPLYYVLDTGVTAARRFGRKESLWRAHRDHYYQQALRNGRSVMAIVSTIVALNVILIGLTVLAVYFRDSATGGLVPLSVGVIAVALVLRGFAARKGVSP